MRMAALLLSLLAVPAAAQEIDHSQHAAAPAASEDDLVGNDPAPPVARDHAADRLFPAERMVPAREALLREGRFSTTVMRIDRLEYRAASGKDGYAFEAQVWTGSELNRFVLDAAGEGEFGHDPEALEASALWRRAVSPYFNVDLGLRHDFRPAPQRTYAVAGVSGLAPYWVEVQGQLLLSDKGDAHARFELEHDMRLTNRLILQPALELDVAFQDVPELDIAGGVEKVELGARLRYQLDRRFAPYLGVHWERRLGGTAAIARRHGESVSAVSAVFGLRTWF